MTCVWRLKAFALESAMVLLLATSFALADDPKPEKTVTKSGTISAHQAVRLGNEQLNAGKPDQALEAYRQAKELEPEAREIGFVEGLAHFDLGAYEPARQAFRKAAGVEHDDLSADALYSLAATDHAEALAAMESAPQEALSQLESAMRRYHEVLNQRPEHRATRDANRRAASMWRRLKQQLQEQKQENQDQNQDQNNEDQEKQDQDQNQEGRQEEGEKQEQQEGDQQEQQEQQSESDDQSKDQQRQAQQQEQVSREQAERQLREMMQAVRDRKKERRELTRKVRLAPVEKDW